MAKLSKEAVRDELWRRGELVWMCHSVQKEMHKTFYDAEDNSILVWLLARQSGKSTCLAILATEAALKKPNSVVKLVTDTKLHAKTIYQPIFTEILTTCPDEYKPRYYDSEYKYIFPNGSQIQLAGSDGQHYERLRGQKSELVLVDEAGFCSDLDDMVISVLLPTTTHTGGKIVLATTPPEDLSHPFFAFMETAEIENKLTKKTVYDNPLLTHEQINNLAAKMGGANSEKFRREYLCDIIKDSSTSVIPEFNDELQAQIVRPWELPPHYDPYVAMDLGFQDLTAVLFGFYDFRADKIVIQAELPFDFKESDRHLKMLSQEILKKEASLWANPLTHEVTKPYKRVSDINQIVTNEIYKISGGTVYFMDTKKYDKEAAINNVRVLLSSGKIIIDPSCTTLIRHLRNARWQKNKDKFARSPDDSHYDFVDALIYFVRSIDFTKNPYPFGYDLDLKAGEHFYNKKQRMGTTVMPTAQADAFRKIFNVKRR